MMWNQNAMMDGFGWFGGGGGMFIGPLIMIGFWALAIYLVVLFFRWISGRADRPTTLPHAPLDILKERYARGEIDEREFTQSKKVLLK